MKLYGLQRLDGPIQFQRVRGNAESLEKTARKLVVRPVPLLSPGLEHILTRVLRI